LRPKRVFPSLPRTDWDSELVEAGLGWLSRTAAWGKTTGTVRESGGKGRKHDREADDMCEEEARTTIPNAGAERGGRAAVMPLIAEFVHFVCRVHVHVFRVAMRFLGKPFPDLISELSLCRETSQDDEQPVGFL
jgi:hypothetical protein